MQWIKKNWLIVAFVLVNLAVAAPAHAGWNDATCMGSNGETHDCCEICFIFCGCELL